MMLSETELQRLLDRVLVLVRATKGAEATASAFASQTGNTRFALNAVTTSGNVARLAISLTVHFGQRSASATTNQLDDRSIDDLVSRVMRMARLAPEMPEAMPPLAQQYYLPIPGAVDAATARFDPAARAKAVAAAIAAADAAKVSIAGFYTHASSTHSIATTAGLHAHHEWTWCDFSCTARTADGSGSGWAGTSSNRVGDLDTAALARIAVDKATASAKPAKLAAGKYTVILEGAAAGSLLGFLLGALSARRADEGRSFFSKAGGGTRLGEKLFPDSITLRSDPTDAALSSLPFDGDGLAVAPTTWIDKGVVTNLSYSRYWAKHQNKLPSGSPGGAQLAGGTATRAELIRNVQRGVLITRFWYLRSLDPQTILATGLTRDGVFLIENGAIAGPVNNFRFNESPVQMLARCDGLTAATIADTEDGAMRVPTLRTHDFNLASVSEAV